MSDKEIKYLRKAESTVTDLCKQLDGVVLKNIDDVRYYDADLYGFACNGDIKLQYKGSI